MPHYRSGRARPTAQPMGTLSTVDRYGLLNTTAAPERNAIDCLFRMLEPH